MKFEKRIVRDKQDLELYSNEDYLFLGKHIEENYGKFEIVLCEKVSSHISVDIAVVEPTPERDFYTLVTMGMGAHRMNVPPEYAEEKLERAELVICLPPDWDLDSSDEIWYWPIRWLKNLCRLHIEMNTWLGWGHTITTNGDVSENAAFRCLMLLTPWKFGENAHLCRLPGGDEINFYQILPIYEGEMEYKLRNGTDALLELFDADEAHVVDIHRESVCEGPDAEKNTEPFINRVERFWAWFSENERELSNMVEKRKEYDPERIVSFIDEGVSLISDDLFFNLGGNHEFNFSVDDNACLFYLLPFLISKMPDEYKEKWKFFPYMPGTGGGTFSLEMYGSKIDADKVMVSLEEDPDGEKYTIFFRNDALAALEESKRYSAFYTLMSNITGELLPFIFISNAVSREDLTDEMFPITELEARLKGAASKTGKMLDPSGSFTEYKFEPDDSNEPRFDVTKGITCYPSLISDYYKGDYSASIETSKYGAAPSFIAFAAAKRNDPDILLEECKRIARAVEEKILGKRGSGGEKGIITGYAAGTEYGYVDMLLFEHGSILETAAEALWPFPHIFFIYDLIPNSEGMHLCNGDGIDLLKELDILHENGAHRLILEAIYSTVPAEEWDFELAGRYARALNNVGLYEDALRLLLEYENEGKDNIKWNFRVGYSLYYLDREAEAAEYFQRCLDLGSDDKDTKKLLKSCLDIIKLKTDG